MRFVTKKDLCDRIAETWREQYGIRMHNGELVNFVSGPADVLDKYTKLVSLVNPLEKTIDQIIGNESWTRLHCDHCDKEVNEVAIFKAAEHSLYLCLKCLEEARMELIKYRIRQQINILATPVFIGEFPASAEEIIYIEEISKFDRADFDRILRFKKVEHPVAGEYYWLQNQANNQSFVGLCEIVGEDISFFYGDGYSILIEDVTVISKIQRPK